LRVREALRLDHTDCGHILPGLPEEKAIRRPSSCDAPVSPSSALDGGSKTGADAACGDPPTTASDTPGFLRAFMAFGYRPGPAPIPRSSRARSYTKASALAECPRSREERVGLAEDGLPSALHNRPVAEHDPVEVPREDALQGGPRRRLVAKPEPEG
jgi:hypothetical protein